jgi:hypothetical protein
VSKTEGLQDGHARESKNENIPMRNSESALFRIGIIRTLEAAAS